MLKKTLVDSQPNLEDLRFDNGTLKTKIKTSPHRSPHKHGIFTRSISLNPLRAHHTRRLFVCLSVRLFA